MKKITAIFLTFFTLLFAPFFTNAQTPPQSITVDGFDVLSSPTHFNGGGTIVDIEYYFESLALPSIVATPKDGQTVLVTQPADANSGVGQVVVCDNAGNPLTNSAYTIRFMRKFADNEVIKSCVIYYQVGATAKTRTFTFTNPQTLLNQIVEPFEPGATLTSIGDFKDLNDNPIAATVIAKTSFFDGGKAFIKINSTGVVDTLNFSALESDNIEPKKFKLTFADDTYLDNIGVDKFELVDGVYKYKDFLTKQIKRTDVTPGDIAQSVIFLYQSYDSVAVRIEAENGDFAIYSFEYGKNLKNDLNISIEVEDIKVIAPNVVNFNPSNRTADMTIKAGVKQFPVASYDPLAVSAAGQTVFISSRPDKNQTIVYVTAQNGDTISYTVNYLFETEKSVRLTTLEVAGNSFIFSPDDHDYAGLKKGAITYTKESQFSNVTILDSDTGAVIIVTAFDGSASDKYFLHYTANAETPEVNEVYYDGTELTTDPMTFSYSDFSDLKLFTANTKGDKYFILQQGSEPATNDVIIRAFSADLAPADNAIEIQANHIPSFDADLDTLFYFDGTEWKAIYGTDLDADPIEIELDNFKSEIPPMSVVADRNAEVTISYAKSALLESSIEVEAENGTKRLYNVKYIWSTLMSSNADLKVIKVIQDGVSTDVNDEDMGSDPISIKYDPKSIPTLSWIRDDNTSMISVDDNDIAGVSISIDAEDGLSSNLYDLEFNAISPADKDNVLQGLTVNTYSAYGTQVTSPTSATQTLIGHTTEIGTELNITPIRNYSIQPIMITNYRGYQNWKKDTEYMTSVVDLGNGGDKTTQKYNIPITSGTTATIEDNGDYSTDIHIFIDGFVSGSDELGTFNDILDHSSEEYDLGSDLGKVTQRDLYVNYDYAGRWPMIEVQTTAPGQQVNIAADVVGGYCKYYVYVYTQDNVQKKSGKPTSYDHAYSFTFVPVGTSTSVDITNLKVNGLTADKNGKLFSQVDGEEYYVDIDSVPLVTYSKENGQHVVMNMSRDMSNPWKYIVHFDITSAVGGYNKTFDMNLYQYKCNDGQFKSLNVSAFDAAVSDYTTETKARDLQWPQLNFQRSAPYDAVEQTLKHNASDFSITCNGSLTPTLYNISYTSTNTSLGAILIDGVEQDLSLLDSDNKLQVSSVSHAAIEVRVAEEGQLLDVVKTPGKDEYVITVTAQNGDTEDYTLVFTQALSSETKLVSLSSDYGFEGDAVFDPDTYLYGAYAHKHELTAQPQWITPIIGDMYAQYYVGQTVDFAYNYNNGEFNADQVFTVTAANGIEGLDPYIIRVKDSRSEFKKLNGLAINGIPVSYFDPDIFDYTGNPSLYPPIEIVGTPRINWSTLDAFQQIECEGEGADFGIDWTNNLIRIKVTAGYYGLDNSVTYLIPITYPAERLNTDLENLFVNDDDLNGVSEKNILVDGRVPDLKNPTLIQPVLKYEGQIAQVAIDDVNKIINVEVTAPCGDVTIPKATYTLLPDNNTKADAAVIDGSKLAFVDGQYTYTDLSQALSAEPSITILPQSRWQTVSDVVSNESGFAFTVTAADGDNKQQYILSFSTGSLSSDADLADFQVDGASVIFDEANNYNVPVGCNPKDVLDMKATLKNQYQSLEWIKTKDADAAILAQMSATVTAQNGTQKSYFVTFPKDNNVQLADLKLLVDGNEKVINFATDMYMPTPATFDPANTDYVLTFDAHQNIADLPGVKFVETNDCQTVTATSETSADLKSVTHTATVQAQDGSEQAYTLTFERSLCDISSLSDFGFKLDGTDYSLAQVVGVTTYESFNSTFTAGGYTKSFAITFNDYVETLPGKDDIFWTLSCEQNDFLGNPHETAEITDVDVSAAPVSVRYTVRVTAQNGLFEDYVIIFYNHTDDVKTLGMIYVQPKETSCYDGIEPLVMPHKFYTIDRNFSQTDYGDGGMPYVVTMHHDCMEDTCVSSQWPAITWDQASALAKAGPLTREDPEWSGDGTYRLQRCTIPVTPIKYYETHDPNDIKYYSIELRDPVCNVNGLKDIYLKHPDSEKILYLSKNDFDAKLYYHSDKSFVSNKVNADGTEAVFEISMPEGWLVDSLPTITYDSLCRREQITAGWVSKDAYGATYEIVVLAQNNSKMTYRLIFTYKKAIDTQLCNIFVDDMPLDGFDAKILDYTKTLEKCGDFPTKVEGKLSDCNKYATLTSPEPETVGSSKTWKFTVQAQDETVPAVTYSVTFTKTHTTEADRQLGMIKVKNLDFVTGEYGVDIITNKTKTTEYFKPETYDYKLYLLESETDFPQVTGIDQDKNIVTATSKESDNGFECVYTLTAPDDCEGNAGQTYTLTIYKYQKVLSDKTTTDDTKLFIYGHDYDNLTTDFSDVTTSPAVFSVKDGLTKIATFGSKFIYDQFYNAETKKYELVYPVSDLEKPTENLHLSNIAAGATQELSDDNGIPNRAYSIKISAENTAYSANFSVGVKMNPNADATLDKITIGANDYTSPETSINYTIGAHDSWPTVSVSPTVGALDNAKYRIVTEGTPDLKTQSRTYNYYVQSQYDAVFGIDSKSHYQVVITRNECDLHELNQLLFNGTDLIATSAFTPTANPNEWSADVVYPATVCSVDKLKGDIVKLFSEPQLQCSHATYTRTETEPTFPSALPLTQGECVVTYKVIAEDGTVGTYIVNVAINYETVSLTGLELTKGTSSGISVDNETDLKDQFGILSITNEGGNKYLVKLPKGTKSDLTLYNVKPVMSASCYDIELDEPLLSTDGFEYTISGTINHKLGIKLADFEVKFVVERNSETRAANMLIDGISYDLHVASPLVDKYDPATFDKSSSALFPDNNVYEITYIPDHSVVHTANLTLMDGVSLKSSIVTGSVEEGQIKYVWNTIAENGAENSYQLTLNYTKYVKSSDTQLASVCIGGGAPIDVLGKEIITITLDSHKDLTSLTCANPKDSKAQATFTQTSATDFERKYIITVEAEDGTTKEYPLTIQVTKCEKYYLTDIKVFGTSLDGFVKDEQRTYTITRGRGESFPPTLADIEYTQECAVGNQIVTVDINNTTTTSSIITITSTAHDNSALTITYTINVIWEMNDIVASVVIYEDAKPLVGFSMTNVGPYTNIIDEDLFAGWPSVTVDVLPQEYTASNISVLEQNATHRKVEVEVLKDKFSNEVFNTYIVIDSIRPCPNLYLQDIRLHGTNSTYDYEVGNASLKDLGIFTDKKNNNIPAITLPKGGVLPTKDDIEKSVVLECPAHYDFKVTKTTASLVMAVYEILITKRSNPTIQFTYSLTIVLTPDQADYQLVDILADNQSISASHPDYPLTITPAYPSLQFSPTQYKYIIDLGEHSTDAFPNITVKVNNAATAKVSIESSSLNNDSTLVYTLKVLDLEGVQRSADYTVEINRTLCSENRLKGITLDGKPVTVANGFDYDFSPDNVQTSIYQITLPDDKTFIIPEYELLCPDGHEFVSMSVDAADSHPTYRDYLFTVKAQNGAIRSYTIREFVQSYSDAQLPEILIGPDVVSLQLLSTKNATYRSNYDYRPERTKYNVVVAPHAPYTLQVEMHDYQLVEQKVETIKSVNNRDSIYVHTYIVTAKDNKTTLTYTVNVYVSCSMHLLSQVTVQGASVMAGFGELSENTYAQYITLPQGSTLPTLADIEAYPLCDKGHQIVSKTQLVNSQFSRVFVISTQSETGISATYTLYYTLLKSSNADLLMINVLNEPLIYTTPDHSVQVNYAFDKNLQSYVVTLDYGVSVTKDDITALLADESAKYVVTGAGKSFQVVVTAQDNTTKTYNLTIQNRPSNEASVADIIVNYESLRSLGFDPETMDSWTYYVENKSDIWIMHPDSLKIQFVVTNATMTGEEVLPRVKQNDSTFTAIVKVTAQDGISTTNYIITIINRVNLSSNALLSDLKVDGLTIDGFSPTQFYYDYQIECGKPVPFVQAQGAEPTLQTITKIDADTVTGRTLVTVTAQDKTSNTYIIQFSSTCNNEPNHNALLSSVTLTDGAVLTQEFDPLTFVYYAAYPEGTSVATIPSHLTYEKQDPKATAFVVEWAQNALDTTKIHVVAEDGLTQNDYFVIYTITGYGNPTLCDLGFIGDASVAGFDNGTIEDFEPETTDYTINLENASVAYLMDEEKVQILAVPCAATASVDEITRTAVGLLDMQVVVKVSDFGESLTYTINVHIAPSSNGNLDNIVINGDTLNGTGCDDIFRVDKPFNSTDTDYRIAVDKSVSLSQIDTWSFVYVLGNAQQQVVSENNIQLGDTAVIRFITVKAGDNSIVEYHLTFVQKNSSTLLNSLMYDGTEVPKWNPESAEFEIYCSYGKRTSFDETKVTYEVQNGFQSVDVLKVNDTTIVVTVTADDCSQGQYVLRLVELDEYSALLKDLTVEGRSIVDFQPRAFYYDYFRYLNDELVPDSVVGIPFDSLAHVEYDTVAIDAGTYIYITVTDRAGFDSNTYVIFFQPVPYDVDARAEVWDVGVVHLGGDIYKLASHKSDVTFDLYDERGYLVKRVSVPVIDPNQSVDDRTTDGLEISIPADRVWLYTFYWQGKYRVERGKLMHISK